MVTLKRIYAPYAHSDGYRVLVDRLWPRGVAKDSAHVDVWLKEVAPSNELRVWFGHDPDKWNEFQRRYAVELQANPAFEELKRIVHTQHRVTLVYSARNEEYNQARVLVSLLG